MSIEATLTIEKALPETDEDSAELVDLLATKAANGAQHVVMDFGHPQSTDPVMRFVEQVMTPLRG